MNEDKNKITSLSDPPEILIEDLGDSDSSSTPLIATKSVCKDPDLKPILKMEKLPKSENTNSNEDKNDEEENSECNRSQETPRMKAGTTKKNTSSSEIGRLLENIPPLSRTASTPVSKKDFHNTTLDSQLSPIREFKTIRSYEKAGRKFYFGLLKQFVLQKIDCNVKT